MRVVNTLGRIFRPCTNHPPKRSERDLFHADGWMLKTKPPTKYVGPAFPAPMLPRKSDLSPEIVRLCNAAREDWSQGNWHKAEQSYTLVEATTPDVPEVLFEHAQLLLAEKQYDNAEKLLLRATEMKSDRYEFWVSLLWISFLRRDYDEMMLRLNEIFCCFDTPEKIRTETVALTQILH